MALFKIVLDIYKERIIGMPRDYCYQIEDKPQLPPELKKAFEDGNLVVFVGAGISRLQGCKGWDEMADELIDALYNPDAAAQIKGAQLSSKEKISIAREKSHENKRMERSFFKVFKSAITPATKSKNIYDDIRKLNTTFITTNCDGMLVKACQNAFTTKCNVKEYDRHKNMPFVFCIHGNYGEGKESEKQTLVFTTKDYLTKYNQGSELIKFLKTIQNKHILFLGYGLREFEILSTTFNPSNTINHYVLGGFFKYETDLCDATGKYYESIGIRLIPYAKDINKYEQQRIIIKEWVEELINTSPYSIISADNIEYALSQFTADNKNIIRQYASDKQNLDLIANSLMDNANGIKWINFLISEKLVIPENMPTTVRYAEGYACYQWTFFDAIINCLKKKDKQTPVIKKFVKECISLIAFNPTFQDNYRIFEQVVIALIILEIRPNNKSTQRVIDLWLKTSYDGGIGIINQNIDYLLCWKDCELVDLIKRVFTPKTSDGEDDKYLWFKELIPSINSINNSNTVLEIVKNVVSIIAKDESFDDYKCIEDRLNSKINDYQKTMIEVINAIIGNIEEKQQEQFVEYLYESSNNRITIQLAFYFSEKYGYYNLSKFQINPFEIAYSFFNGYNWLKKILISNNLSEQDEGLIISWIQEGNFGLGSQSDGLLQNRSSKRINSFRYHLLSLFNNNKLIKTYMREEIIDINELFSEKNFSFQIIDGSKEQGIISDEIPKELFNEELLIYFEKLSCYRFEYGNEYIGDFLRKITKAQFNSFINYVLTKPVDFISNIVSYFVYSDISEKIYKTNSLSLAEQLIKKVIKEKNSSIGRDTIIKVLLNMFRKRILYYSDKNILSIVMKYKTEDIFFKKNNEQRMDIITKLINDSEWCWYDVALDCVIKSGDDAFSTKYKNWLTRNIDNNCSEMLIYNFSLNYQRYLFWNKEFCQEKIWPCIEKAYSSELLLSICYGMSIIDKNIIKLIFNNEIIKETCNQIKKSNINHNCSKSFINYIVSGRYFEYVKENDFREFISFLDTDHEKFLIHSSLFGYSNPDKDKRRNLFHEVLSDYVISHKEDSIYKISFEKYSTIEGIENEDLVILINLLENTSELTSLWFAIGQMIGNCSVDVDKDRVIELLELFFDKQVLYDSYHIKQLLHECKKKKWTEIFNRIIIMASNKWKNAIAELKKIKNCPSLVE